MRDNHEGMPKFLKVFEDDAHFFVVIEISWNLKAKRYQFGISRKSYLVLQRIL